MTQVKIDKYIPENEIHSQRRDAMVRSPKNGVHADCNEHCCPAVQAMVEQLA